MFTNFSSGILWVIILASEDDHARRVVNDGFQRGRAAAAMFHHPKTHVRVVVNGDDFTFAATESEEDAIEDVRMVRLQGTWHAWQLK